MKQNVPKIRLGTHGEDCGSWMSNLVFCVVGVLLALSAVLAALSFLVFHILWLGVIFVIAALAFLALLIWITWIRKQYAFSVGDMEPFAQELRDIGYQDMRLIDTAQEAFGSHGRAAAMMLGASKMLVGRK